MASLEQDWNRSKSIHLGTSIYRIYRSNNMSQVYIILVHHSFKAAGKQDT